MNVDLITLSQQYPTLNVTVSLSDLIEFSRFTVAETKRQIEQTLADEAAEEYISPQKTAELLDCCPATLWKWNNSNYLNHVKMGGKRRYRMSDIQRILKNG